ncbi:complement decay-accelerating factor isoform X2 [Megalobrama amblycephala]|uniref:complement decay-accelerating factor isoform X2 n=1 Tax=Megalobrama amblycephala TaxID=75352 RepID=UPI0020146042|nr:complement decay-accelerating factor isoform X2 [Megalobrama amblycephala]
MTSVKAWPLLLLQFSLVSMEKGCPFPDLNGKIILSEESRMRNNFPDDSKAFVECARGHEREEGSNVIICRSGKWSDPELKCKKIDCGSPEDSPHMTYSITEGTLFGARIKPVCERGYDLEGSSFRQCLVSGWGGKSKCTLITCDEPIPIEHGKFSKPRNIIQFDDVVEYSCDDNYTLVGNRFITCGQYWEYSSPPPECKASNATNKATTTATDTTTATATDTTTASATATDTTTASATATATDTTTATATDTTTATDTDTTTATADTTTATETTTASATTLSNERILYEPLTPSPSESSFKSNDTTTFVKQKSKDVVAPIIGDVVAPIIVASTGATFIAFIICFALWYIKQRGSYNTGEELKTKEELMVYRSL